MKTYKIYSIAKKNGKTVTACDYVIAKYRKDAIKFIYDTLKKQGCTDINCTAILEEG